jgi:phenylacetic acid degradation operon negative regulatory protein
LLRWLKTARNLEPEVAFIARTLLIHDYRRILLKDTRVPQQLLPRKWPGDDAKELTASAYRALAAASVGYITSSLESERGLMPAPDREFARRFQA